MTWRLWGKKWWASLRRFYYKWVHSIDTAPFTGSLLPELGSGKYVSVFRRGSYIDIVSHQDTPLAPMGLIRLVPTQYNHGVMVEFWEEYQGEDGGVNSYLRWRTPCQYEHFFSMMAHVSEEYQRNHGVQ
jgi:hypothetical protein